jgi:hypothetical protein
VEGPFVAVDRRNDGLRPPHSRQFNADDPKVLRLGFERGNRPARWSEKISMSGCPGFVRARMIGTRPKQCAAIG